jgi:hypothetical protein
VKFLRFKIWTFDDARHKTVVYVWARTAQDALDGARLARPELCGRKLVIARALDGAA